MSTAYTALQPCRFGENRYYGGEIIPEETILSAGGARVIDELKRMGVLAPIPEGTLNSTVKAPEPAVEKEIILKTKDGKVEMKITADDAETILRALLSNVTEAEKTIQTITNNDSLIVIDQIDIRKSIKDAAQTRAKQLMETELQENTQDADPETDSQEAGED